MQWYAAIGDLELVLRVWDEYRLSSKQICTESYNIVMGLYVQMCKDTEAVEVFYRMIDEGAIPNSRTYTIDEWTVIEKADLECAVAMSLSEQVQKGKNVIGNLHDDDSQSEEDEHVSKAQLVEHEQLAKALQESYPLEEDEQLAKALHEQLAKALQDSYPLEEDEQLVIERYPFEEDEQHVIQSYPFEEDEQLVIESYPLEEDEQLVNALHESYPLEEHEQLAKALQESYPLEEDEQLVKALHESYHLEEDEQLAKALQESYPLAEDEQLAKALQESYPSEEDEQLAKALHESLLESPPRYGCNTEEFCHVHVRGRTAASRKDVPYTQSRPAEFLGSAQKEIGCLTGYPNLSPEVEEGICQVLAHMWMESEILSASGSDVASSSSSSSPSSSSSSKKGKRSEFEKKLGEFFKHQIETDTSSDYGDGFRKGNEAARPFSSCNTPSPPPPPSIPTSISKPTGELEDLRLRTPPPFVAAGPASAFFASLERSSCINLSTTDIDDIDAAESPTISLSSSQQQPQPQPNPTTPSSLPFPISSHAHDSLSLFI
ncbi:protein da1-related 1 [Quercus suber]|uniref:Protein da1-related 1 n=1 Tax=Quercus suber TaxID=58331 RepID=A0AAW0KTD5_QUESU